MANIVNHFSHPHHQLVKSDVGSYGCDLCGADGSGIHYRCYECDFDIHESCARLPETISFFAHPWHNLHLMPGKPGRYCDLCFEPVNHFYYHCTTCGCFDVHPHCTATKQAVRTRVHPEHDLYLLPGNPCCDACDKFDGLWLYSCGICEVNLHIKCLNAQSMPKVEHGHMRDNNTRIRKRDKFKNFLINVGTGAATGTATNMLTDSLHKIFSS